MEIGIVHHMDKHKNKYHLYFFCWFFERVLFYVKARKFPPWPSRYNWLREILKTFLLALRENPIRALRFCGKLFLRENSGKGFILLIFGPKALRDTLKACEDIGLKPLLLFGTLRGLVIQNDFLSKVCSGDIDFGLFEEDFQKKHLLKEVLLKKGYQYCCDNDYELVFMHPKFHCLLIDFYRMSKIDGQVMINVGFDDDDDKYLSNLYFPSNIFYELHMVNFQRNKVLVPRDPEKFLLLHYGQQWRDLENKFPPRRKQTI